MTINNVGHKFQKHKVVWQLQMHNIKLLEMLQKIATYYFLLCNKKSRFDFADELKVGDVRYKHLT